MKIGGLSIVLILGVINFILLLSFLAGLVFSGGMLVAALAFAFSDLLGKQAGPRKPQR